MKPEVKEGWLAALRSGEYLQMCNGLSSSDGASFCCLGVLCDLHAKAHGNDWARSNLDTPFRTYLGTASILPQQVMEWSGLTHDLGWADEANLTSLAGMNDDGMSFKHIADFIEVNL